MKKQLLILSALGIAGAASAQSSVTLFGVLDATVAYGSGSVSNRTRLFNGGLDTPRIGFRGVEDLGGGMRAEFRLEAGLNNDDGTAQATNTNNQASGGALAGINGGQGLTFNRRSYVALAGPWGEVQLGRLYVPQYWNLVYGDPFGNVGVGAAVNFTQIITGITAVRASNGINYFTGPLAGGVTTHAGFGANLMHYRGENPSGTATSDDGTGNGVRVWYGSGPFLVAAAWGRTEYAAGDSVQRNILGSWDFKVVKVMATLNRDRAGALSSRGGMVGASAPVGVGELKAAYSVHKTDAAGSPEAKKLALGYVHHLSKRTALYTTVAAVRNSGGAAVALNGAVTGPNGSSKGLDLGVRHSF